MISEDFGLYYKVLGWMKASKHLFMSVAVYYFNERVRVNSVFSLFLGQKNEDPFFGLLIGTPLRFFGQNPQSVDGIFLIFPKLSLSWPWDRHIRRLKSSRCLVQSC